MKLVGRDIKQLGSSIFLALIIKKIAGKYCQKNNFKYEPDKKLLIIIFCGDKINSE